MVCLTHAFVALIHLQLLPPVTSVYLGFEFTKPKDASLISVARPKDASLISDYSTMGEVSASAAQLGFTSDKSLASFHARASAARAQAAAEAAAARAAAEASAEAEDHFAGSSGSGPKTLKAYCDGTDGFDFGQPVKVDWMGFGTMYRGSVQSKNEDGTYDVIFYDGFVEKGVPESRMKPLNHDQDNRNSKRAKSKAKDPACELKEMIKNVKDETQDAYVDITAYLADEKRLEEEAMKKKEELKREQENKSEEAKKKGDQAKQIAGASVPVPATAAGSTPSEPSGLDDAGTEEKETGGSASEGSAPASAAQKTGVAKLTRGEAKELRKLKETLRDLREESEALEEQNAKESEKLAEMGGAQIFDNPLLQEYRMQVVEEKEHIRQLEMERRRQEKKIAQQHAKRGTEMLRVQEHIKKLQEEFTLIRKKREQFAKENRLDPELKVGIDNLLDQQKKLMEQMLALQDAAKKSEEAKQAAKNRSTIESEAEYEAADQELQLAAAAVGRDLRQVSKQAHQLDTGVHPHGTKWWRYRFEHNYVESTMLVCIVFLMMIFEALLSWARMFVLVHSQAHLRALFTAGTMHTKWIEQLLIDLAACLLTTITVLFVDKVGGFELLHRCMQLQDDIDGELRVDNELFVHFPHSGLQYKSIALDVSSAIFLSLIMYSFLSRAGVKSSMLKLHEWAEEAIKTTQTTQDSPTIDVTVSETGVKQQKTLADIVTGTKGNEYMTLKTYFDQNADKAYRMDKCEFWKYLRLNVQSMIEFTLRFGIGTWSILLVTFALLAVLHRYCYMDYMPSMVFFFVMTSFVTLSMILVVRYVKYRVSGGRGILRPSALAMKMTPKMADAIHDWQASAIHRMRPILGGFLQYNLFFLCFGFSRIICFWWLWDLYFQAMVFLSGLSVVLMAVYIFIIAPILPMFTAAIALPPYANNEHIEQTMWLMKYDTRTAQDFVESSRTVQKEKLWTWEVQWAAMFDLESVRMLDVVDTPCKG